MSVQIQDGESHGDTGEKGVTMKDGVKYFGPVWKYKQTLWVCYKDAPHEVLRNPATGAYELATWWSSAQSYLQRLGMAEYKEGMRAWTAKGRKAKTYRHQPSEYHLALVELLGKDDEEGFKALKNLQGYASALGV